MRKTIIAFLLLALLFVPACSGSSDDATDQPSGDTTTGDVAAEPTPGPFTSAEQPCQPFDLVDDVLLSPVDEKVADVSDADLTYGPDDASYKIYVYSNFTCGHCANLEPVLEFLQSIYPDDVQVVFRYVTTGGVSTLSAQAVEAANIQGKFSEMKDAILNGQSIWWEFSESEFRNWLNEKAEEFGMDVEQFNTDMDDENTLNKITFNRSKVDELGIMGTPTMYVNKRQYSPYQDRSVYTLSTMISLLNISDQRLNECPTIDTNIDADLQATITTDKGEIVIDLYEDQVPYAVAFFKYLVDNGWYDNNPIFVATDEYVISGDPSTSLYGGPGFAFYNEVTEGDPLELLSEEGLLVTFNRLGPGYNTGAFMLTKGAVSEFSGDLTILGKVVSGLDILKAIENREYSLDPSDPFLDTIVSITITEK